jgi:hypothetical protein
MTLGSRPALLLAAVFSLALVPPPVLAQDIPDSGSTPTPDEPVELTDPGNWVLGSSLGAGSAGGQYGDFLEDPVNFDLNLGYEPNHGPWRFGIGIQFGSMNMKPPYEDQKEWARFDTYLYATRIFNKKGGFRPYLHARVGVARIHPRSELFYFDDPENLEFEVSPTKAANGLSFTFQPGVEIELGKGFALDVAGWYTTYRTGDYSTVPPLEGPVDPPVSQYDPVNSGSEWGLRAGVQWRPLPTGIPREPKLRTNPETGLYFRLAPADEFRDEWGVSRSWGWATGEMLGINFVASMLNEYVRNANFNQISPRSFYANLKRGWTFDDNEFKTNQLVHPFNGQNYFNAARTNGLGFWQSSLMANAGAFIWECCGETHPMSWNDMISTGIGGMARGEWAYRISSLILDNTKTGWRRYMREFAALPFNPIRTGNRFVSYRATTPRGNPASDYDWRPPHLGLQLYAGARAIGEGESITENTNYYGFIEGTLQYGSAFKNERRRPFDRFDTSMQLNYGDKTRVGQLIIRGDLASWPLGEKKEDPKHVFAITQEFDYVDNEAYEYGGQFFGGALFSGWGTLDGNRLVTRLTGYVSPMAAINSEYSFLADVGDRQRFREYDYGPGVGAGVDLVYARRARPLLAFSYRYTYIPVRNGSIWNPDDPIEIELPGGGETIVLEGSDANHHVHRLGARLLIPFGDTWGIGADGRLFIRDSSYTSPLLRDQYQRNPEVRVYMTWDLGYTKKRMRRLQREAALKQQ